MRNYLSILFASFALFTQAQITVSLSDYGKIGDKTYIAIDTPVASSIVPTIMLTGANKTWNFASGVIANTYDSFMYVAPAANAPSGANLKILSSTIGQQYNQVDASGVKMIIDRSNNKIDGLNFKILSFPLTYGNTIVDSLHYYKAGTPTDFNAPMLATIGYDSVRAEIHLHDSSTCVGYGTLVLPDTSLSVLQVKITTVTNTNLYAHSAFTGWVNINSLANIQENQRIIEYQWYGKNTKGYMARALMDTTGQKAQNFIYRVRKITIPKLVAISPAVGMQTQNLDVHVFGLYTHFTQGSSLSVNVRLGASKLFVNSVTVINDTALTVNVSVLNTNQLGNYDVVINDPISGVLTMSGAFKVVPLPSLKALSPASAARAATHTISVYGISTHFKSDSSSFVANFYEVGALSTNVKVIGRTLVNDTFVKLQVSIDAAANKTVYTLKVGTSIDGLLALVDSFRVDNATGITINSKDESLAIVYPNPVSNYLNFDFKNTLPCTISVVNTMGELVLTERMGEAKKSISIESLAAGIYLLTIEQGNSIQRIKLIKQD